MDSSVFLCLLPSPPNLSLSSCVCLAPALQHCAMLQNWATKLCQDCRVCQTPHQVVALGVVLVRGSSVFKQRTRIYMSGQCQFCLIFLPSVNVSFNYDCCFQSTFAYKSCCGNIVRHHFGFTHLIDRLVWLSSPFTWGKLWQLMGEPNTAETCKQWR